MQQQLYYTWAKQSEHINTNQSIYNLKPNLTDTHIFAVFREYKEPND